MTKQHVFVCNCVIREFVQTAWEDIERFKEQKDKDLREALISYAIMQISMCKKVCMCTVCSCMLDCLNMPGVWVLILQQFDLFF